MYTGGEELWSSFGMVISMMRNEKSFISKEFFCRSVWTNLSSPGEWNGESYW